MEHAHESRQSVWVLCAEVNMIHRLFLIRIVVSILLASMLIAYRMRLRYTNDNLFQHEFRENILYDHCYRILCFRRWQNGFVPPVREWKFQHDIAFWIWIDRTSARTTKRSTSSAQSWLRSSIPHHLAYGEGDRIICLTSTPRGFPPSGNEAPCCPGWNEDPSSLWECNGDCLSCITEAMTVHHKGSKHIERTGPKHRIPTPSFPIHPQASIPWPASVSSRNTGNDYLPELLGPMNWDAWMIVSHCKQEMVKYDQAVTSRVEDNSLELHSVESMKSPRVNVDADTQGQWQTPKDCSLEIHSYRHSTLRCIRRTFWSLQP